MRDTRRLLGRVFRAMAIGTVVVGIVKWIVDKLDDESRPTIRVREGSIDVESLHHGFDPAGAGPWRHVHHMGSPTSLSVHIVGTDRDGTYSTDQVNIKLSGPGSPILIVALHGAPANRHVRVVSPPGAPVDRPSRREIILWRNDRSVEMTDIHLVGLGINCRVIDHVNAVVTIEEYF